MNIDKILASIRKWQADREQYEATHEALKIAQDDAPRNEFLDGLTIFEAFVVLKDEIERLRQLKKDSQ